MDDRADLAYRAAVPARTAAVDPSAAVDRTVAADQIAPVDRISAADQISPVVQNAPVDRIVVVVQNGLADLNAGEDLNVRVAQTEVVDRSALVDQNGVVALNATEPRSEVYAIQVPIAVPFVRVVRSNAFRYLLSRAVLLPGQGDCLVFQAAERLVDRHR